MNDNLMIANSHPPEEWSGITFNTGPGRVVIRITSDGKLEKAEGYSTEEAAQVMFDAVSDHIDGIWKKVRDENAALEEHIDRCERLLRCWCKPGTFSNSEELRMETLEMLDGRPEKARSALEDLTSENARLKQAISQLQKLAAVADKEIFELRRELSNK